MHSSYRCQKNRLDYYDKFPQSQFVDTKLNVCKNHPDTMECSLSGSSIIPKYSSGERDRIEDNADNSHRADDDDDDTHGVKPYYRMTPLLQRRDLIDREFRWLIPLGVKYLQELWEDESTDSSIIEAVLDHALKVSETDLLPNSVNIHSTDSSYVDIPEDHEDSTGSFTATTNSVNKNCNTPSNTCTSDNRYAKVQPIEKHADLRSNSNFYSSPYDLLMTLDVARK